jgi:hypothetical protein
MLPEKMARRCLFRKQNLANFNVLTGQGAKVVRPAKCDPPKGGLEEKS